MKSDVDTTGKDQPEDMGTWRRSAPRTFIFSLVAFGTILGIAGTDLILPAIPSMREKMAGTPALAQMVLASYAAGALCGLLAFGELGARYSTRMLLVWSVCLFAVISVAAAFAPTLGWLVVMRFFQGALGSAPAVFAPGFIQRLYNADKAPAMFGRLGAIESLTPALAPVAGVVLLNLGGWQASFIVLGLLAVLCAACTWLHSHLLPITSEKVEAHHSYLSILRNLGFVRHALSQALSLAAILVFVFGAPAVIVDVLNGSVRYFILLQVSGVAMFIVASNVSGALAARIGIEHVILGGTWMLLVSFLLILVYVSFGDEKPSVMILLWVFANGAFGIRGPIGFHQAILASNGDHSRAAALIVATILGLAAAGTAVTAPFLYMGWWPLACAGSGFAVLAITTLTWLSKK